MCNLSAWVWVFVPGYGACGQLYSPEVAAMIYPIPHVLFTRWWWHSSHREVGSPSFSNEGRPLWLPQPMECGRNDATRLLRLDHKNTRHLNAWFSWDAHSWKPATMLWGSLCHRERPLVLRPSWSPRGQSAPPCKPSECYLGSRSSSLEQDCLTDSVWSTDEPPC